MHNMEIIENIFALLGLVLLFWSTLAAFKVSKPLAVGVFFLWIFFFPYFAFKYGEAAKGPINLFLFIFFSVIIFMGLEYVGIL